MKRLRAAALVVLAAIASQAGHLVAYQLRFGAAAQAVQSSGAHLYFPPLAKTGIGIAAAAAIGGLLITALARVASGRRIEAESAPPYLRLLAGLFTLQLGLYCVQETLEARLSGVAPATASDLILWGAVGQIPIAAAAGLALRWLSARLRPALQAIGLALTRAERLAELLLVQVRLGVSPGRPVFAADIAAKALSRRGPPPLWR